MNKRHLLLLLFSVLLWSLSCMGQTSREEMFEAIEKTGGVYYAYPVPTAKPTLAPKGYEPFYISHYGRHGSRYLISDRDYRWVIDLLQEAHERKALTPLGEDAYQRLCTIWEEAEGRGGDLSPLGERQHRGIAERMYRNYPQVFQDGAKVCARSTIVMRCALSMVSFGTRLKELNPELPLSYEASEKYMNYLNFHTEESNRFTGKEGPLHEEYRKFEAAHTHPERLVNSLFSDADFVRMRVNPENLMWGFYWIASDMQDMETPVCFYDLFEKQELFDLWQCINYRFYAGNANHAAGEGIVIANAKPLLKNILDSADEMIRTNGRGATLRFGHDGNVIPLAGILRLENCNVAVSDPYELYKVWSDFKIVPMAGNVQLIFFRKGSDVLVKFLLNEQEVHIPVQTDNFPFYRWKEVSDYYRGILAQK